MNVQIIVCLWLAFWASSEKLLSKDIYPASNKLESAFDLVKVKKPTKTVTLKAVLVICDNYISPENNAIAQSVRVDMGTLTQVLTVLEKRSIAKVEKIVLQGRKATRSGILQTLKTIQSQPDDIILFYFSGHGGMTKGKSFIVSSDEKDVYRGEIESLVNGNNARLKIIITDACSNDADGLPVTRSLNRSNDNIESGAYDGIYRDLFLGYKGLMHISSSSEGEYAWSDNKFGGYFTYHFFKEGLLKKPVNDWKIVFANAKDKTAQLFLRNMTNEERKSLAKEGVKSQTAKAISMPGLIKDMTDNKKDNTPPDKIPGKTTPVIIPSKPNDNKARDSIVIINYTSNAVSFYIDNNAPKGAWLQSKLKAVKIDAGKSFTIYDKKALVGFNFKGKEFYYELEKGKYFFALDENQRLDLFLQDDSINNQNYTEVARTDFIRLLQGNWQWQDAETGESVLTTFKNDNFSEQYGKRRHKEKGTWSIRKENIDGEDYDIISFMYVLEDGSEYILEYAVFYDLSYPKEIQLVFMTAYENGEELEYDDNEDDYDATIVMAKVN